VETILEIQNLSLSFGPKTVFQKLSLKVYPHDGYGVWGPSGGGKSVLLKVIAGLTPFAEGSVRVEGVDLRSASEKTRRHLRTRIGLVFQEGALISNMSVYDNIALPLRYHTGLNEEEVRRRVDTLMAFLEIEREFDRAIPAQVGMGLKKRAAFARALILEPSLLLLDEPVLGLDEETTRRIFAVLKSYRERTGAALLFTTAKESRALSLANRIGFLENGKISFEGAPEKIGTEGKKDRQSS
jgi:phospholipid/cholesterol/gamma-HCH transport system ATP-binding protein